MKNYVHLVTLIILLNKISFIYILEFMNSSLKEEVQTEGVFQAFSWSGSSLEAGGTHSIF